MDAPTDTMVSGYRERTSALIELIRNATDIIKATRSGQEADWGALRDLLSRTCSLRKVDFENATRSLRRRQAKRERRIEELVECLEKEREDLGARLDSVLASPAGDLHRRRRNGNLRDDGRPQLSPIQEGISSLLLEAHQEQAELAAGLKRLLAKGQGATIEDLNRLLRGLEELHRERRGELGRLVADLRDAGKQIRAAWPLPLTSAVPIEESTAFSSPSPQGGMQHVRR